MNQGHPNKFRDQVSDAMFDVCLALDPKCKVACETATKDNVVMVTGEINATAALDYEKLVRDAVATIGFDSCANDMSNVDSKDSSNKSCKMSVRINKQNPGIASGGMDVYAEDQEIMFNYASD